MIARGLIKPIGIYFLFCLLVTIFCLMLFSVVSHFHLFLGHDFSIVGDWMSDYGWEMASLSKLFALALFLVILSIQSDELHFFKKVFFNAQPDFFRDIYVVIIFLSFMIIFFHNPIVTKENGFHFLFLLASFVGPYIFYMVDIIVLNALSLSLSGHRSYSYILFFSFSLIHYVYSKNIFFFAKNFNVTIFFNMLILVFLSQWKKNNWIGPSKFCLLFICPFSILFGMDPMWASRYSPFEFSQPIGPVFYGSMAVISLVYLCISANFRN